MDGMDWSAPDTFRQLESMSFEELNNANESDATFDKLFDSLEEIKEVKSIQEKMHSSIETMAKENLSRETEMETHKDRMATLQKEFIERRDEYQRLYAQYQGLKNTHTKDALLALLRVAVQEAEDASEESITKFSQGAPAHEFIHEFMERRTLYHTRAAKVEKLQHTI